MSGSAPVDMNAIPSQAELDAAGYQGPKLAVQTGAEEIPTSTELQQAGYKPPADGSPSFKVASSGDALTGLYRGAIGEVGSLGAGVVRNVGKLIGDASLTNWGQERQDMGDALVNQAKSDSPIAGEVGKLAADTIGAAAVTPSTGILGLAAGGALASAAVSKQDSPLGIIKDAGIGGAAAAVGGSILGAVGKTFGMAAGAASAAWKARAAITTPETFADNAISATLDKVGDSNTLSSLTPSDVIQQANKLFQAVGEQKDALYKARDVAVLNNEMVNGGSPIVVDRQPLMDLSTELQKTTSVMKDSSVESALKTIQGIAGDGTQVPFALGVQGVKSLGNAANIAGRSGDASQQRLILQAQTLLKSGLDDSVKADPSIMELHNTANDYYSNVYKPLKDLNLPKIVADKLSETKYLASVVNKQFLNNTSVNSALVTADPGFQGKILGANINALKAATSPDGYSLDLSKFSKALSSEMKVHGAAYGEAGEAMQTLADALHAGSEIHKTVAGGAASAGIYGLVGNAVGGPVGAGLAVGVPRTSTLYGLSKVLDRPGVTDLLAQAKVANQFPQSSLARDVFSKVSESISNAAKPLATAVANGAKFLGSQAVKAAPTAAGTILATNSEQ